MAVVVQCYNCSNILELDEGFRGGVCRCSQCGSLLQVPKGSSTDARRARPATPDAPASGVQRPSNPTEDPGLSRGQFDPRSPTRPASPGDSGLGAKAVGVAKAVAAPAPPRPSSAAHAVVIKKNRTLFYVAIILMVLIGIGLVGGLAWFFARATVGEKPDATPSGGGTSAGVSQTPRIENPGGPMLLANIPLTGSKIVFCMDGGSANQESFDFVRKGVEDAINTLGAGQQFTVAIWRDDGIKTIPASGWASKATFANYKDELENAAAFGSSDPVRGMVKSLELPGDQVIFVTAKYGLTSDMAAPALAVRKPGQRIDAIKIGSADTDSPLEKIVNAAGGKFVDKMEINQLESIVNH
jgi:hypothetical protein